MMQSVEDINALLHQLKNPRGLQEVEGCVLALPLFLSLSLSLCVYVCVSLSRSLYVSLSRALALLPRYTHRGAPRFLSFPSQTPVWCREQSDD